MSRNTPHQPGPEQAGTWTDDSAIAMERIRLLYSNAMAGTMAVLAGSLIVAYIFYGWFSPVQLGSWISVMVGSVIIRLIVIRQYNTDNPSSSFHKQLELRYVLATGITAAGWSMFILMALHLPNFEHHIYSMLILVAVMGMAVPVLSPSLKTLYIYLLPPAAIATMQLVSHGGKSAALGSAFLVFTLMLVRSGMQLNKTLTHTIRLRLYNQNLVEDMTLLQHEKSETELLLQDIIDNSPSAIYVKDLKGKFTFVNQKLAETLGRDKEGIVGKTLQDILPKDLADDLCSFDMAVLDTGRAHEHENSAPQKDGIHHYLSINFPMRDETGRIYAIGGISTDITDRTQIEETLRHSQKMDAIGKLTGGISHDFNNMLNVILGFSELLKTRIGNDEEMERYVGEIQRAGERARKLTSKLLDFSRTQPSTSEYIEINSVLQNLMHMLEKTLTARIQLKLELGENVYPVWLDKTRLEDSILNLSINAMHAMPNNGTLTLSTSNICIDKNSAAQMSITPGDYLLLSVCDTGIGIDSQTLQKIFDPFFSTKGEQGTGLGLSQVYGFIQQSNGAIRVESTPGQGTCFSIYLPRTERQKPEAPAAAENHTETRPGQETILVVDDEAALMYLAEEILETHGYKVLCAESGEEALEILDNNHVDLVFSDVIMPGMNGYQLAEKIRKHHPDIRLQMTSGYTDYEEIECLDEELFERQLRKPYNSSELLKTVRKVLDNGA